jgi:carboxyl-terminal processing protease
VQTVFNLTDTEAVKLTTAKYYTPSGRCINKDERDHLADDSVLAMNDDGGEQDSSGAPETKLDAGSGEVKGVQKDHPVFYTSSGRTVYGGGGITPDVNYEPREYTDLQRRLERDGLGFSFAIEWLKTHDIKEDFKPSDAVLADFYKFLDEKKFEYKKDDLTPENVDYIRTMIAREAVNNKFGRHAMYKVLLDADPEVQETIQLIDKHPTLKDLFAYSDEQKAIKKADASTTKKKK